MASVLHDYNTTRENEYDLNGKPEDEEHGMDKSSQLSALMVTNDLLNIYLR